MTIEELITEGKIADALKKLDEMQASKAFKFIKNNMNAQQIDAIKASGKENYQLFQDIKARAKESWNYDHKTPIMADVDRACMNVYTIILKLMKANIDDTANELNKIKRAINRIEEKIGLEATDWDKDGGTINANGNEQRSEENI